MTRKRKSNLYRVSSQARAKRLTRSQESLEEIERRRQEQADRQTALRASESQSQTQARRDLNGKSKKLKKMVKGSAPMKLNIKVEVEEYSEDIEQNKTENIKPDHEFIAMDSTTIKDEPRVKVEHDGGGVNASNGNTADSDEDDDRSQVSTSAMDEDDNDFFKPEKGLLKNIYDLSHHSARSIQQCKLSEESFFKELNELSKIHLSMADRILLVESRNTWGRTSTVTLKRPRAEVEIQNVINEWNKWILTSKFKDTPLMYKCYMCKKAWWCLYDFREHLVEKHDSEQFHCYFETMFPVCNIIAGLEAKPEFDNFSIDTDCLKCGNDYKFHQRNKGAPDKDTCFYVCQHCDAKFYTCSNFVEHQGDCVSYRKFLRNSRSDLDVLEFYRCLVCKLVLVSKEKLRKHYSGVHSVRSDMPITTQVKVCLVCNVNFSDRLFHKCLHKNYSIMCSSCKQSFPTRVTRNIHKTVHKKNFRCRICNVVLDSDCMETQHIASTHSTNFRIIYKCPTCKENIFLLNDLSSKQHTLIWHKKRFDKRRMCFEMVVVPAKCLTETVEQMDIVTSLSGKFEIKAKPNQELEIKEIDFKNNKKPNAKPTVDFLSDDEDLPFKIVEDDTFGIFDDAPDENTDKSAFANVVLSIKSEKDDETNRPKDEYVPEAVAKQASDAIVINENIEKPLNIKIERDDDFKETDDEVNFMVDRVIKQEPEFKQENFDDDYEMLLSKVFGGSHCSTSSMGPVEVKQEIEDEEFFEDDIIVLAQNAEMEIANEAQAAEPKMKKERLVTEKPRRKLPRKPKPLKPLNPNSKKMGKKKCTQCDVEGSHFECVKHLSQCKDSYKCTKCNLQYISIDGYTYHFEEEHGIESNFCPVCDNEVERNLPLHIKKHIGYSFSKVQLLDGVDDKANIDLLYYCKDCKEPVDVECMFEHWEAHLSLDKSEESTSEMTTGVSHSSLEPKLLENIKSILLKKITNLKHSCLICKRKFYRRNDIKRHLIEHLLSDSMSHYNQQGGLECQFCSKVLNKADMYRWHMRDHASLPVYKCGICCKTFSDSSNFAKHRKTHNFHSKECDVCHKKFLSDVMLAKHVELHYNKGPITCTKCNKEFFEDSAYRRHMRSAHGDKARFTCPVCKEKFDSLRLKWDHMWTAHNQRTCQADCPICRKSFRKYQDVRVHLRDVHNRKAMFLNQKLIKILPKVINDYKAGEVAGSSSQIGKVDNEMYVVYEEEEKEEGKEEQSDSD